jgi:hypothetical protein
MASGARPEGLAIIQLRYNVVEIRSKRALVSVPVVPPDADPPDGAMEDIGWRKFGASELEKVLTRGRQRHFAADRSARAGRASGFADLVHTK